MDESVSATDVEAELRHLRARAYGPDPDILDDPDALARLAELESAHRAERSIEDPVQAPPEEVLTSAANRPGAVLVSDGSAAVRPAVRLASLWRRTTATRGRRVGLIAGVMAIILTLVYAVMWYETPKPDATLHPSGAVVDGEILSLVSAAPLAQVDDSTLRGYEAYRGVEPWLGTNAQGALCLMAMERSSVILVGVRCAPPEAELMLDLLVWAPGDEFAYMEGLANGTVIRFHVRRDAVDAFLYVPPSAE
jgi:hypothetical protein